MRAGTAQVEKAKEEKVADQKGRSVCGWLPLLGTPRGTFSREPGAGEFGPRRCAAGQRPHYGPRG